MKYAILVLVSLFTVLAKGQSLASDLASFANWLDTATNCNIDLRIDIYYNQNDTIPYKKLKGRIVKNRRTFYSSLYGNETISEGRKILWVNNQQKVMLYKADAGVNKNAKLYNEVLSAIDSTLRNSDTVIVFPSKDGKQTYGVIQKDGFINTIYLTFDEKHRLMNCTYYYNVDIMENNNKVFISYNYISKSISDEIGIDKYITIVKGRALPTENYKLYEIKMQ